MAQQHENRALSGPQTVSTSIASIALGAFALLGCTGGEDPAATEASETGTHDADGTATGTDDTTDTGTDDTTDSTDTGTEPYDFFEANAAYADLHGFSLVATGTRDALGQGPTADTPIVDFTSFETTLAYDVDADALRVDWTREVHEPIAGTYAFSEIVAGRQGYIDGVDNLSFLPPRPMTPQRVAAVRKQQRLLHPAIYIHRAIVDPSAATVLPDAEREGAPVHVIEIADDTAPVRLYIDVATEALIAAETVETDHLLGDLTLAASYTGWLEVEGLPFPGSAALTYDGRPIHRQSHTGVELNPRFEADTFELTETGPEDPQAHQSGDFHSQWHLRFGHLGIPIDGPTGVLAVTELAPGVVYLQGPSHHTLAIELEDGVLVIDPVVDGGFAESVLANLDGYFGDKSVTRVLCTHHHFDHVGGVRAYAAAGAELIVSEEHLDFFEEVIARPHTLVPDALEQAPQPVALTPVPAAGMTIEAATVTIELYTVPNSHSEGMLAAYLPELQMLFQTDLYSPKIFPPGALLPEPQRTWSMELNEALLAEGLDIQTIVGGHGLGVASLAELLEHIGE